MNKKTFFLLLLITVAVLGVALYFWRSRKQVAKTSVTTGKPANALPANNSGANSVAAASESPYFNTLSFTSSKDYVAKLQYPESTNE